MSGGDRQLGPPVPPARARDFYQRLRERVRAWSRGRGPTTGRLAELTLAAPDLFHLVWRLSRDPRVPARQKAKLALVVAYFVSPVDLLPEALLGPVGFADDAALAALAIRGLVREAGPEVVREHWAGQEDVLVLVDTLLRTLDERLGAPLVRRLRRLLG